MKNANDKPIIIGSSILLAALVAASSMAGLLIPGLYSKETENWQIQAYAQDEVNLFLLVPAIFISGVMASKYKTRALWVWTGIILYTIYTFTIYCFDIKFNSMFLLYCITLGLSVYTFLWSFYRHILSVVPSTWPVDRVRKITSVYFIVVSLSFYFLWLADIIPSTINRAMPQNLAEAGVPTNPVHVIDLALFLPAVFITGLLVWKKKHLGAVLAVILLSFFIVMNATIAWLNLTMIREGFYEGNNVTMIMSFLVISSAALLILNLKGISATSSHDQPNLMKYSHIKSKSNYERAR